MSSNSRHPVLAMLWLRFLGEVDLVVHAIVVIPVILSIDAVPNTEEHGLVLQVCQINQLDAEVEAVTPIVLPSPNIVVVISDDLGGSLPIVKRKSGDD